MSHTICPVKHGNKRKKFCYENLIRFVIVEDSLLSPALKAVRTRAHRGYCGYYGYLPTEFPLHYTAFRNLHDVELSEGQDVDLNFGMNAEGLINFIVAVGPVPSNLQNPILVRVNPERGYYADNMKWENEKRFRPISARRALTFTRR